MFERFKALLHFAIFRATCLATNVTYVATVENAARKVAETVAESRTRFFFLQRFQATILFVAQSHELVAKCENVCNVSCNLSRNAVRNKLHEKLHSDRALMDNRSLRILALITLPLPLIILRDYRRIVCCHLTQVIKEHFVSSCGRFPAWGSSNALNVQRYNLPLKTGSLISNDDGISNGNATKKFGLMSKNHYSACFARACACRPLQNNNVKWSGR